MHHESTPVALNNLESGIMGSPEWVLNQFAYIKSTLYNGSFELDRRFSAQEDALKSWAYREDIGLRNEMYFWLIIGAAAALVIILFVNCLTCLFLKKGDPHVNFNNA